MKKYMSLPIAVTILCVLFSSCSNQSSKIIDETLSIDEIISTVDKVDLNEDAENYLCGDVEYVDAPMAGEFNTYEEMQEIISVYAPKINFVRYTIYEVCTEEEKLNIQGKNYDGSTLYKANINYDYLNAQDVDKMIYISKAGNMLIQPENQPIYKPGETYASMIMNLSYDSWNVALPELSFSVKNIDDKEYLYQIKFDFMKFIVDGDIQIGQELKENEMFEYTSTKNNPVKYVRKYLSSELVDFLKSDWIKRGYTINPLDATIFDTDMFNYTYTENGSVVPVQAVD